MREQVTIRWDAAASEALAESCPKPREFPEQLLVLVGLTLLVLGLAAWVHAIGF